MQWLCNRDMVFLELSNKISSTSDVISNEKLHLLNIGTLNGTTFSLSQLKILQ
jgi:hypothetical protein